MRIGDLLIDAGVITQAQLSEALGQQRLHGGRLGTNLVELGFVDERTLASVLARQLTIPSATAAQLERSDAAALRLLPGSDAERLRSVPLREDAGKLWVAMADPTDSTALAEIAKIVKMPVRPMVAPELLIQYALERHYKVRRKPRAVAVVPTGPNERPGEPMLTRRPGAAAPPPLPPPASAPVWDGYSNPNAQTVDVDDFASYIDEQPGPGRSPPGKSAPAKPRILLADLANELAAAPNDETIIDLGMRFVAQDVRRVAAFVFRQKQIEGWRGLKVDDRALKRPHCSLDDVAFLAQVVAAGNAWVGALPPHALGALAVPLEAGYEAPGILVPLRIGKRSVGLIVGVEGTLDALGKKGELDKLATKLDQALHIGYLRRQLLAP